METPKKPIYKVSRSISLGELQRLYSVKFLKEACDELKETIYEMKRKHEAELGEDKRK